MKKTDYLITGVGIIFLGIGMYMIKALDNVHGFLLVLQYVFVGMGCGIWGHGMSNIISKKAISKDAKLQRQLKIEKNDERNNAIANKSKAKGYDLMTFVFGILILIVALMEVDMIVILLLIAAYLLVHIYAIYYRFKYEKEM